MKRITYQIIKKGDGSYYVKMINNNTETSVGLYGSDKPTFKESYQFLQEHKLNLEKLELKNKEEIVYSE